MSIRAVTESDWPRIAELSGLLVEAHHGFNPSRFVRPDALPGPVYTLRVRGEVERGDATVFVATADAQVVGFIFAGIEPESWKELRPVAGYIQDLVVDARHRNAGIGRALLGAALDWF